MSAATGRWLLCLGLILAAFNLRLIFPSLSVVLPEIMRDLSLSPAVASALTTLPVVCLGLFAPAAPILAGRFGVERVILALLTLLALGTAMRGLATLPALAAGSVLAGGAIAMVNVLLPGLVKRDFPERAAPLTGLFTMALCAGAALAAAATVPLEHAFASAAFGSWPAALAAWAVPAVLTLPFWLPNALPRPAPRAVAARRPSTLLRQPLAWQVTLFMGFQSSLAYAVFGWMAPILRERGLDADTAGYVVSVSMAGQMTASLVAPSLATRGRDQRPAALVATVLAIGAFLTTLYGPLSFVWAAAVAQGLGQGALIAIALTIIILRSPDIATAARLSGMAQGIGYLMAASGPLLVGLLRDWTGSFAATGPFAVLLGLGAAGAGFGAGRARLLRSG